MGVEEHRKTAVTGVRCCVLTISDTRAPETDVSGRTIVELLEGAGHVVAKRQILRDDPKDVHEAVLGQVGGVDAIITTGGTGITSRDSTYEAIAELFLAGVVTSDGVLVDGNRSDRVIGHGRTFSYVLSSEPEILITQNDHAKM